MSESFSINAHKLNRRWSDVNPIVDSVHIQVCGHADYSDFKVLLQRNNMCSDDVNTYLTYVINKCRGWRATAFPQPSQKFLLKSINRSLNECGCVDHMLLDENRILHVNDSKTRLSKTNLQQHVSRKLCLCS